MSTILHINSLQASTKIALWVAEAKNNVQLMTLVKICIRSVCLKLLDESLTKKVAPVPLSNYTKDQDIRLMIWKTNS